jgi:glycolate oxidase FAD binding subunit
LDIQQSIVDQIRNALDQRSPLAVQGGMSKAFYGNPVSGEPLDVSGHQGVIEYDPGELVITCRAGSSLSDIRAVLAENGQHLPFDPPAFGAAATIGGTVACGFSGPGRPWSGSLRDYLLGVKLVNGAAQTVRFGGQVMKNVAGYDISRLVAGSMGTLGVLLEVSFKVLPLAARELTLSIECNQEEAIHKMNLWSGQPLPLSGATWWRGLMHIRLSGAVTETEHAASRLNAVGVCEDSTIWRELREHKADFFKGDAELWRVSLPSSSDALDLDGDCLLDWAGAQRWYRSELPAEEIRDRCADRGGFATLFRGATDQQRFQPLPAALREMHFRIKQAFDPHGLFNPNRMSPDW